MCIVCRHNQIKDIDRALLTGTTLTSLNQKYGFSTSALHRHQEHLMQKMARAQKRFHDGLHQGLYCKLNIVMELVLHVVRGANAGEISNCSSRPAGKSPALLASCTKWLSNWNRR